MAPSFGGAVFYHTIAVTQERRTTKYLVSICGKFAYSIDLAGAGLPIALVSVVTTYLISIEVFAVSTSEPSVP